MILLLSIQSTRNEGSVLHSSLLESDRAVFAHLALAIELFALFPLWCRHITAFHPVCLKPTYHRMEHWIVPKMPPLSPLMIPLLAPCMLCIVATLRGRDWLILYLHARTDVHVQLAHNYLHLGHTVIQ